MDETFGPSTIDAEFGMSNKHLFYTLVAQQTYVKNPGILSLP
jgi:hypothetical protein